MSILWGSVIDGSVYGIPGYAPWNAAAQDTFEQHTGKRVSLLNFHFSLGGFYADVLDKVSSRGAIPLVTVSGGTMAGLAAGHLDEHVKHDAAAIKAHGGPVLLRPWWEMNGNWYSWSKEGPANYRAGWQRYASIMHAEAPNASLIWCVNVLGGTAVVDPLSFYPGDEHVDYTGIDGYNWGTAPGHAGPWKSPAEVFQPTVERLAVIAPTKKIIICETASTEHGGSKAKWIKQLLGTYLPSHPRIVGFTWFNDRENADGMDWIIETSKTAQTAFKTGISSPNYKAAT